jgi:hypothetical protein
MTRKSLLGIAMVVLGIAALAYQGFSYTVPKKEVELGPIQVTKEERHTAPLPPVLGALAVIGGIVVLLTGGRDK